MEYVLPAPYSEQALASWRVQRPVYRYALDADHACDPDLAYDVRLYGQRHPALPLCAALPAAQRRRGLCEKYPYAVRLLGIRTDEPASRLPLEHSGGDGEKNCNKAVNFHKYTLRSIALLIAGYGVYAFLSVILAVI